MFNKCCCSACRLDLSILSLVEANGGAVRHAEPCAPEITL